MLQKEQVFFLARAKNTETLGIPEDKEITHSLQLVEKESEAKWLCLNLEEHVGYILNNV